jgi:hypothetical protein
VVKVVQQFVLVGLLAGALVGCGGSELPLVPVSGRITFNGGPCPKGGSILFVPGAGAGKEGLPNRPGRATFDVDGKFVATSYQEGDGLLPGRYQVNVECVNGVPGPTTPWDSISYVPANYHPDELVVEEGQDAIVLKYDVPPKKK